MVRVVCPLTVVVVMAAACDLPVGNSISPSNLPVLDTFSGSLTQNGSVTFAFDLAQTGPVAVTLTTVAPMSVAVGLGIGTPRTTGTTAVCTPTKSVSTVVPGPSAQLTVNESAGSFCIVVSDVGNLTGPSTVTLTVGHL